MRKRIFSLLLCIVMVLSLMPTAVFAAEGDSGVKLYVRNPKPAQNEHEVVAGKTFTVQAVATGLGSGVYLNDSNIEWTLSEHHDGTTLSLNDAAQVTRDLHVDENETAEIITITATLKSDPTVFGTYYVNVRPQPKYVSEINLTYNTSLINTGSTYAEAAQAVADNYAVSGDGAIKGYYSSSNCSMYQLNDSSKWPITSDAGLSVNCTYVRESTDTISTDKDLIFVFPIQAAPDTQHVRPLAPEYDFDEDNLSGITVKINGVNQDVVVRSYNDAWRSVKLYVLIPKGEIADTFKSVAVTGVSLNKSSTSITFGKNEQLTATVLPEIATNKSVTWTSDNTSVATVNAYGNVHAQDVGTATITVTTVDGGFTASCEVTVTPVAVTGVTLNETSASIVVGATEQLTATVAPENAPNKNVTWTSSNTSVATVDADGVVTAVAAGTATITVTTEDGGKTATCEVTVTEAPADVDVTGVTLNETTASIVAGATTTLTATVAPDNATNKNITWTSDNTSVATVADGVVTAVAAGTATITVTTEDGDFSATCEVTVTEAPVDVTGVSLDKTTASIVAGATTTLTATVAPDNATNKNITWTSDNTSVATVADGVVTAVAAGTATITVTTEDGGKTATCAVTVTKKASGGSSSGGSSSGSSAPATYAVKAADSDHGSVTVSPKSASAGDTVKVTVNPDKGYTLETITVTDKNGKEVALTATEIGETYTFKMPSGGVEITATFMEDNTMLNYFVDVSADTYYYDAVLWAAQNGITGGVDAVHFDPNAGCTRAQVVTFLWRAAGCPEPESAGSFADVNADAYYTKAIAWAAEQGITGGTSATTFSPDATCTRAQIMTFLYRFNGQDTLEIKDNPFGDVAEGQYYSDAVLWGAKNGITGGTTATTFSPDATCTRAQIVTFLYRYMV